MHTSWLLKLLLHPTLCVAGMITPVPQEAIKAAKEAAELKRLEGRWAIKEIRTLGDPPTLKAGEVEFKGNRLVWKARQTAQFLVTVDTVTEPPRMTMTWLEPPKNDDKPEPKTARKPELYVYGLAGDTLTLCGKGDLTREFPTKLSVEPDSTPGSVVVILKRIKE